MKPAAGMRQSEEDDHATIKIERSKWSANGCNDDDRIRLFDMLHGNYRCDGTGDPRMQPYLPYQMLSNVAADGRRMPVL